uniref:TEN-D3 n=1 Tax=Homo sapiens TaxID=9606 RepID=UPI00018380BA|nr:Chain A, TEN-D3 [Homo sapiens]3B83_B Chain B, TEN-D3 [Homo sapiens]3B83_C Chain C, TEN-D3 [Homo sapiens]3B83_D Chain D, TEN-D3 [Homo sapiens]3B83_E Chain E, TEN-D3 [Homo sapiens]3B83_F Chain F, TEN-D3 [Homo sapiens]3B83_G Chain G, TEN-D3 [Homo sapiens]3B83_H Chain H, TEN-D3 [Homo sapiens]
MLQPPFNIKVTNITLTTAVVTWQPPILPIEGILVTFGRKNDPSDETTVDLTSSITSLTLTNLEPNTTYEIRIVARNGQQYSPPVSTTFTTGSLEHHHHHH